MNITLPKPLRRLLKGGLLKASALVLASKMLGLGLLYVFTLLLARHFGETAFGHYALATTVLSLATMFARNGMDTATLKKVSGYRAEGNLQAIHVQYLKSHAWIAGASLLISALLYGLAGWMAEDMFRKPAMLPHLRLAALAVAPYALLYLNGELLRGLKQMQRYVLVIDVFIPSFGLLLFALALGEGRLADPTLIYVLALYATLLASYVLLWRYLSREHIGWAALGGQQAPSYKEIRQLSAPMFFFSSLLLLDNWTGSLLLGIFGTVEDVGVFRVVMRLSALNILVLTAVNTVLAPRIAELYSQGRLEAMKDTVRRSLRLIFWGSLPLQLLLFLFPGPILGLFGEAFKAGTNALLIVLLGQLINALTGPVTQILNMTSEQRFLRNVSLAKLLITLGLNVWLIPSMGIVGVAISVLVAKSFANLIGAWRVRQVLGFWPIYLFSGKL